jgi:hypothetical protein
VQFESETGWYFYMVGSSRFNISTNYNLIDPRWVDRPGVGGTIVGNIGTGTLNITPSVLAAMPGSSTSIVVTSTGSNQTITYNITITRIS